MSAAPEFATNFSEQLIACLRKLNSTTDPAARFDSILRAQAAFNILRSCPEGAQPYDPILVEFVETSKRDLDFLYELEFRRNHFFCEELLMLRNLNNTSQQPPPPLPRGPPPSTPSPVAPSQPTSSPSTIPLPPS